MIKGECGCQSACSDMRGALGLVGLTKTSWKCAHIEVSHFPKVTHRTTLEYVLSAHIACTHGSFTSFKAIHDTHVRPTCRSHARVVTCTQPSWLEPTAQAQYAYQHCSFLTDCFVTGMKARTIDSAHPQLTASMLGGGSADACLVGWERNHASDAQSSIIK